jgi:hypothetical protein
MHWRPVIVLYYWNRILLHNRNPSVATLLFLARNSTDDIHKVHASVFRLYAASSVIFPFLFLKVSRKNNKIQKYFCRIFSRKLVNVLRGFQDKIG